MEANSLLNKVLINEYIAVKFCKTLKMIEVFVRSLASLIAWYRGDQVSSIFSQIHFDKDFVY